MGRRIGRFFHFAAWLLFLLLGAAGTSHAAIWEITSPMTGTFAGNVPNAIANPGPALTGDYTNYMLRIQSGGSITGDAYGAYTYNGRLNGNTINMFYPGSVITGDAYGGYTANGEAYNNGVVVMFGKVNGHV